MKITPEVEQIFTLTARIENEARNALSAQTEARAFIDKLKARPHSTVNGALIRKVEEIAPAPAPAASPASTPAPAAPPAPPTLASIAGQMIAAVMSMQGSEMHPTAVELEACAKAESAYTALMARWSALTASVTPAPPKSSAK